MITNIEAADGRTLEVLVDEARVGLPLVFHNGLPSAVVPFPALDAAAASAGLYVVTYSRPGYGTSSPRADGATGYRVADDVADTTAILDHLGIEEFVTLGWSGGGPRALACAGLMPGRCLAAATLAGVAPVGQGGMDNDAWLAEMGPENVRDFNASIQGREALQPLVDAEAAEFAMVTGEQIVAAFGGLVSEVDAAALTGDFADYVAADFRRAMEQGSVGMRDDNLAVVQPWGFDLNDTKVPVAVWQGRQDKMVPFAHGLWLADHVPGAIPHLYDDEGHLSLVAQLDRILADLVDLTRLGT